MNILVLHGPNLNLLGGREAKHYGAATLPEIDDSLMSAAKAFGHQVAIHQCNAEHELVELIHEAKNKGADFILFNPAAFTHTSIVLRDALLAVGIPFIEIHLSNIHGRETFRQKSYFSDIAVGVVSGFGAAGYLMAMQGAHDYLSNGESNGHQNS